MTIAEMKECMQKFDISDQVLSVLSGIPISTLQEIFSGKMKSPPLELQLTLEQALLDWKAGYEQQSSPRLNEQPYAYSPESSRLMTVDDYYALPDERRVELIDGKFYDMAAPTFTHQNILGMLYIQFFQCIDSHGDQCAVYLSPCDVQLDKDIKTMVQPDLLVICNKDLLKEDHCYYGAPDLVVEILSPSTRAKDMLLKLNKYLHAGVREYWIVDSENLEVLVYVFSKSDITPEIYSFDDRIPIHISDGKCHIDFAKIHQKLS